MSHQRRRVREIIQLDEMIDKPYPGRRALRLLSARAFLKTMENDPAHRGQWRKINQPAGAIHVIFVGWAAAPDDAHMQRARLAPPLGARCNSLRLQKETQPL